MENVEAKIERVNLKDVKKLYDYVQEIVSEARENFKYYQAYKLRWEYQAAVVRILEEPTEDDIKLMSLMVKKAGLDFNPDNKTERSMLKYILDRVFPQDVEDLKNFHHVVEAIVMELHVEHPGWR